MYVQYVRERRNESLSAVRVMNQAGKRDLVHAAVSLTMIAFRVLLSSLPRRRRSRSANTSSDTWSIYIGVMKMIKA
jgi:hypothetical protein